MRLMDTSVLKLTNEQRTTVNRWFYFEDYLAQNMIQEKVDVADVEGFLNHVDEVLAHWIEATGNQELECFQPMLFDYMLNDKDISIEAVKTATKLRKDWKPSEDTTEMKVTRKHYKKQSECYERDVLLRVLFERYNESKKDIKILTDVRDRLLVQKSKSPQDYRGQTNYVAVLAQIAELSDFKCSHENVTDALYREKPDNIIFSGYE